MNFETILVDQKGNFGWITINRPEVRNALNELAYFELNQAITKFDL